MLDRGLDRTARRRALDQLAERARRSRGHVLTATSLAASGHPGGSFSSMEIYTLLYSLAQPAPGRPALGRPRPHRRLATGTRRRASTRRSRRRASSPPRSSSRTSARRAASSRGTSSARSPASSGRPGNLGQGLSAGVGLALGARLTGGELAHLRGDERRRAAQGAGRRGAPARGQGEPRQPDRRHRLQPRPDLGPHRRGHAGAHRGRLGRRRLARASSATVTTSPRFMRRFATRSDATVPTVVVARTVIGKGVSFMEDLPEFHGRGLTAEEYPRAMAELGLDPAELDRARRAAHRAVRRRRTRTPHACGRARGRRSTHATRQESRPTTAPRGARR